MSTPDIDTQRQSYDAIWEDLDQSSYRRQQHLKNRHHAVLKLVEHLNLDSPRILEVGCGFGALSGELARHGRVTGVDLSPRGIEIARRSHPEVEFFAADLLTGGFPGADYDLVVSSEVIEHIAVPERERFVAELAGRLRAGGHLILTTPNARLSQRLTTFQLIEEHFTRDALRALLETRFAIDRFTSVHRVFPVWGHRSKPAQALRAGIYELLRLRPWLEDPFRASDRGLYFVLLAHRRA